MIIKGLLDEDFINYKKPSMTIMFPYCSFKCGFNYCQNSPLSKSSDIEIQVEDLVKRYINNPITESVVCQGLEPLDSWDDLIDFIKVLRIDYNCKDDVVIYTGYTEDEAQEQGYIDELAKYENIIVKFGRYIPEQDRHFDTELGVYLASDNQYAKRLN